jgi:Fe-S-cluster-containing hydrogenase component 2
MPKKTIVVDYQACDPEKCDNGVCEAALVCERKILTQESPYEMPDTKASMCLSCSRCMLACSMGAIRML